MSVASTDSTPSPSISRTDDQWRECYPLHATAFDNDHSRLATLIKNGLNPDVKDIHGNTALHISVMLGHQESIEELILNNAAVKIRNIHGWTPLHEAVSYGDREIISILVKALRRQARESFKERKHHLIKVLKDLDDFYLELRWEFQSWVPFVSRMLPSDVCKIYKRDGAIRFDTSIAKLSDKMVMEGDISLIYNSDAEFESHRLVIIDNKGKRYQCIKTEEKEDDENDKDIDMLMSNDIVAMQMSTKTIEFVRASSGWVMRRDRTNEMIGDYAADVYDIVGLTVTSRKRREHLSDKDISRNKKIVQSLKSSNVTDKEVECLVDEMNNRKSLEKPIIPACTFQQYCDEECVIGRKQVNKTTKKHFKAHAYMSTEFPLKTDQLVDILEMIAPQFKHIEKLRNFCMLKIPPGFPVRLELPIFPTVTAIVTFQKMHIRDDLSAELFEVPPNYDEVTQL